MTRISLLVLFLCLFGCAQKELNESETFPSDHYLPAGTLMIHLPWTYDIQSNAPIGPLSGGPLLCNATNHVSGLTPNLVGSYLRTGKYLPGMFDGYTYEPGHFHQFSEDTATVYPIRFDGELTDGLGNGGDAAGVYVGAINRHRHKATLDNTVYLASDNDTWTDTDPLHLQANPYMSANDELVPIGTMVFFPWQSEGREGNFKAAGWILATQDGIPVNRDETFQLEKIFVKFSEQNVNPKVLGSRYHRHGVNGHTHNTTTGGAADGPDGFKADSGSVLVAKLSHEDHAQTTVDPIDSGTSQRGSSTPTHINVHALVAIRANSQLLPGMVVPYRPPNGDYARPLPPGWAWWPQALVQEDHPYLRLSNSANNNPWQPSDDLPKVTPVQHGHGYRHEHTVRFEGSVDKTGSAEAGTDGDGVQGHHDHQRTIEASAATTSQAENELPFSEFRLIRKVSTTTY